MFKLGYEYSYKGQTVVYIGDIVFYCFKNEAGELIQLDQEQAQEVTAYVAPAKRVSSK